MDTWPIKIKNNTLFIDADVLVALSDKNDPLQSQALELSKHAFNSSLRFVTTDYVIIEAVTVLSQNTSVDVAYAAAMQLLGSTIELVYVNELLLKRALSFFSRQTSKNARMSDCINMVYMRDHGLNTVFSFDKHYRQNGFKRFGIDNE